MDVTSLVPTPAERLADAAPLLRSVFEWLESQRDEADRADRAFWQDQIHNLGGAMAILRLPFTEE